MHHNSMSMHWSGDYTWNNYWLKKEIERYTLVHKSFPAHNVMHRSIGWTLNSPAVVTARRPNNEPFRISMYNINYYVNMDFTQTGSSSSSVSSSRPSAAKSWVMTLFFSSSALSAHQVSLLQKTRACLLRIVLKFSMDSFFSLASILLLPLGQPGREPDST